MAIKYMNNSTMENEIQEMSSNGEIILQNGTLGDIPLLLFSATNNGYKIGHKHKQNYWGYLQIRSK